MRPVGVLAAGLALCLLAATAAGAATATAAGAGTATAGTRPGRALAVAPRAVASAPAAICVSASRKHRKVAGRMSRGIAAALAGRSSIVGLAVAVRALPVMGHSRRADPAPAQPLLSRRHRRALCLA